MTGRILNARVTFRNAPIHVLERFAIRDVGGAYGQFLSDPGLDECVIVQTCNRVELFGRSSDGGTAGMLRTWAAVSGMEVGKLEGSVEVEEGRDALRHLLKLASGLDSMVLGEEQILGQIRESVASAKRTRASGPYLNALFEKAMKAGARIRSTTGIGRGGTSVGSMAVRLAEENVEGMRGRRVLLIGTGEVSTLVAKSLKRRGYGFEVASRTLGRSEAFCKALGGSPVRFEDVLGGFSAYDVVFVATSAPYLLVTRERIAEAMGTGRGGMMILDLSNPRTVDEGVATIGGVRLMNLDQIAEMVERNVASRRRVAREAEGVVGGEVEALEASMKRLEAEPLVGGVFRSIDSLRERQLQKALRMLGETDGARIKIIDDLTREIVEGIVSTPMNNIRRASERGRHDIVELAAGLFDYGPGGAGCGAGPAGPGRPGHRPK